MDIPDLVKQALGDEEIQAGVSLGDEDAVCLTPTRTLVYRGEGLISDEQVEEYSHDVEQLAVSEGRRKTKFTMGYIDGTQTFTVPSNRGETVLELFLEGVLRLDGVIESRESLAGIYRFSELTLIIAEQRLVKHIGSQVWTEDYEVYPYEDVTGLDFEQASVATSVALTVDGRPQRVKVPSEKAAVVRRALEELLFDYHDVGTLAEFNRAVGGDDQVADTGSNVTAGTGEDSGFTFGDDFDPLVSDDEGLTESAEADNQLSSDGTDTPANTGETNQQSADADSRRQSPEAHPDRTPDTPSGSPTDGSGGRADEQRTEEVPSEQPASDPPVDRPADASRETTASSAADPQRSTESAQDSTQANKSAQSPNQSATDRGNAGESDVARSVGEAAGSAPTRGADGPPTSAADAEQPSAESADAEAPPISREEYETMTERLEELTEAVDRQNELLKRQHRTLKQLVKGEQSG